MGETNPDIKFDNEPKEQKKVLEKKDIIFNIDVDGKAIPEQVEVEVYNRVLDDEILLTTMELDNALVMHESTKKASDITLKSMNEKLEKLKKNHQVILSDKNHSKEELTESKKLLAELEKAITDLSFQVSVKLNAYLNKVKECREDICNLQDMINKEKTVQMIEVIPCTVAEAHRYFTKNQYKNDKGEWVDSPKDEENKWITQLLSKHIISPKLTEIEWDHSKPEYRMSLKEKVSEVSGYSRVSPKEYLIEKRRSERLKNIEGEY